MLVQNKREKQAKKISEENKCNHAKFVDLSLQTCFLPFLYYHNEQKGGADTMQNTALKKRDLYLNRMIAFQDTEMIKVMTGIRRCGKSSLMKLMAEHLRESGVQEMQIIEMNFESMRFSEMDARDFYAYVKERILPNRRMYLFFDEVQRIKGWENAVNSFRVDFDCDIYLTGSNAYLCLLNSPPTCPGVMLRSRCFPFLSGSSWIFTAMWLRSENLLPEAREGESPTQREKFMRNGSCLTPMPALAGCQCWRMLAWRLTG